MKLFGIIAICFLLFSGCEFQTKDSEVEKLRIANQKAAAELQAAVLKHQAESFERVLNQQSEAYGKTISEITAQNKAVVSAVSKQDLAPYLMMIFCMGIAIGCLVLCLFLLNRTSDIQERVFVLNQEGELKLISNQLLIGHRR